MVFKVKRREPPSIEIAPLIDVVFLLLLFFMVTTQFVSVPGLMITLPTVKRGATVTATAKVEVHLNAAGDIFVAGNPVSRPDLPAALSEAAADPESAVVVLAADEEVPHGKVVSVLDVVRRQGFRRLVIAARWGEKAGSR